MTSRARTFLWSIVCLALGGAIWFVFPALTAKANPYDDDRYWACMLATSTLAGLLTTRNAWLSGLALAAAPLGLFCAELVLQASEYWWPGLGIFLAFVVLSAVVAQLAATLRQLAMVALGRTPSGEAVEADVDESDPEAR